MRRDTAVFGNGNRLQMAAAGWLVFGPQWFFVMARPAIIQQDEAVFFFRVCVYAGTSNITALSSAAPQESRHTHKGGPGVQSQRGNCISVRLWGSG